MHGQKSKFDIVLEDMSGNTKDENRITGVTVACENISNFISIPEMDIISTHKNFYSLKLNSKEADNWRIPCTLNVPQYGDNFLLNLLIVYKFESAERNALQYRIIQASMSAPLWPSLKIVFSSLKFIDAYSSLGLLKLENLTTVLYLFKDLFGFKIV